MIESDKGEMNETQQQLHVDAEGREGVGREDEEDGEMNHEQQPLVQVRQQRNGPRNSTNSLFDPLPIVIENDEEDEM